MDNCTYSVLNGARMYPLEKMLRCVAKADGSYVVAVLDCCREKLPKQETRGFNTQAIANDGLLISDDQEWIGQPKGSQENIIITYGCQPSDGVPQKSKLAKSYFRYLRKSAQDYNDVKCLMLPGCLNFFQNKDGRCEHNIKAAKPIMLEWDDHADGKTKFEAVQQEEPVEDEEGAQPEGDLDGEGLDRTDTGVSGVD